MIVVALGLSYQKLMEESDGKLEINNAFISGRVVQLKSSTAGLVETIYFAKGQQVKAGDLLFEFDSQEINLKIDNLTQQLRKVIDNELRQCFDTDRVQRKIELSRSNVKFFTEKKTRLTELAKVKIIPQEDIIAIDNDIQKELLNQAILETQLKAHAINQKLSLPERASIKMAVNKLKEAVYQHELHKQYAPSDGYIYDILTYKGQRVDEDTSLMVFLPNDKLYIEANALESNLMHLEQGRTVDIEVDADLNGKPLKGHVHSIVPAVAASFSALPRNNTDSNWIKVAQRVPVLIEVDDTPQAHLPIGTSVKVVVDIKNQQVAKIKQNVDVLPQVTKTLPRWQQSFDKKLKQLMKMELSKLDSTTLQNCRI